MEIESTMETQITTLEAKKDLFVAAPGTIGGKGHVAKLHTAELGCRGPDQYTLP